MAEAAKISELEAQVARLKAENAELQQLCIETQAKLNEEAPQQEQRDAELRELQELCVSTQAKLNEDVAKQEARDAELAELKQLCIDTQANLNKQLMTPEAQKDAELEELRTLCIQTQAKLCEDASSEDTLRAELTKKDAEIAELTQLCIDTQRKLCEEAAAEEGRPPASATADNKDKMLRQRSLEAVAGADGGKELLVKAMSTAKKGKGVDENMLSAIWDEFDANKDGKLTLEELKPLVKKVMEQVKVEMTKAKAEMKAEMSQQLEGNPMGAMMLGMVLPMMEMGMAEAEGAIDGVIADPTEAAEEFMREIDTNEDGTISRDEFLANGAKLFPDTDMAAEMKEAMAEMPDMGEMGEMGGDDCCIM